MKRYLRHMPEPLLTSELYPFFLRAAGKFIPTADLKAPEKVKVLRLLLLLLPMSHLVLFETLLDLFGRIAKRAHQNQMTAHNLGRVLAPNIIRTRSPQIATSPQMVEEYEKCASVLEFMIENRFEFFLTIASVKPFLCLDALSIKV